MQLDSLIWETTSPRTHKPKIVNKSLEENLKVLNTFENIIENGAFLGNFVKTDNVYVIVSKIYSKLELMKNAATLRLPSMDL